MRGVSGPGAYRDERPSLEAENARLQGQLEASQAALSRRRRPVFVALAVLVACGVDAAAFFVLRDWINGRNDTLVYAGFAAIAVLVVLHALVVALFVRRSR